ncbi:Tyrosine-protein kinase YwqD [Alteripontixanthobacter maritimus]|uniref:Tyrosine-protein kinase YwqD n=1 Tax=Alteripontixanthobacter maritimus TaxID=2161824 RepID=A0A369QGH4_9SPHN|nr:polysaccharide biosynthesis tyrosine autokinase [Alteripontixanthobacter maritimus]RDC61388.1 Tyrosine-protein kinase YwqD [Alteripontixanthobacter maritimus]
MQIAQNSFDANQSVGPHVEQTSVNPLEHYIYVAQRNWKVIAAIMLGATLLGVIVTLLTTPQYRAEARIEISRLDSNVTNVEALDEGASAGDTAYLQTQYELLEARSLAERVGRAARLDKNPTFLAAYELQDRGDIPMRNIVNILLRDAEIEPVVASNLVDIQYKSPDADLSAKIANTWAAQFLEANLDRRFGANIQAREFIAERLEEVQRDLEKSERALITYANDKQLITLGGGNDAAGSTTASRTLVTDELEALSSQLAEATAARIAAEAARSNSQAGGADTRGLLASFRRELTQAEAELAKQSAVLGPEHPTIIALRSQISTLSQAIADERRRSVSEVRENISTAQINERALRSRIEGLKGQYLGEQRAGVQYAILDREVRTNRELYDALLQQYKNLGAAGVGRNNMSIVDLAEIPRSSIEPNLISNMLLFLALGVVFAGVTIVGAENIDRGFQDPDTIAQELSIPLLGAIPLLKEDKPIEELGIKHSDLYEAYTTVRSNLSLLTSAGMPSTMMLTSSRAAEGKSLTAFALSKITADQKLRTLLIDSDMRDSGMHKYITVENTKGLSGLLAGAQLDESFIHRPSEVAFDVMTAGRMPPNAAELLSGPAFKNLIEQLREKYDHIIIDGPPVLGLADAQEIGRIVEGTILVVEAGASKRRTIKQTVARLERAGTRIFGTVMTKVPETDMAYGYGYGTAYGYGYGRERNKKIVME